jgi:mono/diheme cytochrome c family protein
VGVYDAGEHAQTAVGAGELNIALATGQTEVLAGREAFSAEGLGCATCHGDRAQGERGPSLAGGRDLEEFRSVHQHGLFPRKVVSDRDFAAIDAWLKTLRPAAG